jgi:hypothetical protein
VNERIPLGRGIVALLKSAEEAVTIVPAKEKTVQKKEQHSPLYYDLQSAFHDVKLMVDGKKCEKTLDELIYELRNSND